MKTEFSILWVDDQPVFVEAIEMNLRSWLDEKGFDLKVVNHKDATGVLQDIKTKEVELIIIDQRLSTKNSENGDVLIEEIRRANFYHDIVFYSEGPLPEKRLDGVFHVSKGDATTRIKELIELKLKRSSDPVSFRGWIVADSIELEVMLTDLLARCFTSRDGFTFSERFLYDHKSPIDFGRKSDIFNGILVDFVAWHRNQASKDDSKISKLSACKEIHNSFKEEVVEIRNAIAHQQVEETATGKVIKMRIKKETPIVLNETTFIKIRKDLRKHRDNLIALQSLIE